MGRGSVFRDWGYAGDDRMARKRRINAGAVWGRGKKGMLKQEGDQLSISSERMKRMRSVSPAVFEMSVTESKGARRVACSEGGERFAVLLVEMSVDYYINPAYCRDAIIMKFSFWTKPTTTFFVVRTLPCRHTPQLPAEYIKSSDGEQMTQNESL